MYLPTAARTVLTTNDHQHADAEHHTAGEEAFP